MAPGDDTYEEIVESRVPFDRHAVLDVLSCPVCMNLMCPPIHQCPNGHTICSDCKAKVNNSCPICRQKLGNIRCLALEKITESLELPCKYRTLGCEVMYGFRDKFCHEENCQYRPYNCPYSGDACPFKGDIPFLISHLKNDHDIDMHDGCTFNHRYIKSNSQEFEDATWMLTIFNCFGYQFCLHFEAFHLGTAPVYIAFMRFMGNDLEAQDFRYYLEVGGYGRKLTWQGVPRSIHDSRRMVLESLDGLIIQRSMALFFSGDDPHALRLKVAGRIWKEHS